MAPALPQSADNRSRVYGSAGSKTLVSGEISILTSSPGLKLLPCCAEVIISTRTVPPGIVTS